MKFDILTSSPAQTTIDCLVVGVHDSGALSPLGVAVDRKSGGALMRFLAHGDFAGRLGETLLLPAFRGLKCSRVLLVGQGKLEVSRRHWRKALTSAVAALAKTRVRSAAIALTRPATRDLDDYLYTRSAVEAVSAALYRVNDLKSGKKAPPPALEVIKFAGVRPSSAAAARRGVVHGLASANGAKLMRDLANLPGNVCTPTYLGEQA